MRPALLVCTVFALATPAMADGVSQKAVDRAHAFLKTKKTGEYVNGFVHFGTTYVKHNYVKTLNVNDRAGRAVPGHFALVYDFEWTTDGKTQLGFLCDARGNVYEVQSLSTNAVFQQPFAAANLSIKLIGEGLYEAFKDNMTQADRDAARKLIDDANARGLLQIGLRMRQMLE